MKKISIITTSYNSEKTINQTLESVTTQDYPNIEYIIIDGASTDNTLKIIENYSDKIKLIISEPDQGMYDALNKGLLVATGDVVGILNSDDIYSNETTITGIMDHFNKTNIDMVWGDVVFVDDKDKIKRLYSGNNISSNSFNEGIMPPHPSVFIKKECYDNLGNFNIKYKFADYDLLLRFIKFNNLNYLYIPSVIVRMKLGGASTKNIFSIIKLNKEIIKIHKDNNDKINLFSLVKKVPRRLSEILFING